jgi:acetyltransferase-like isoleucine patch superfamily enzyme
MNNMSTRATGDAIPKSGLRNKVLQYIEHVSGYRKILRFIVQGTIFILFKQFPTIAGTFLRPFIYRKILGKVGNGCLIERNVRMEIPSKIFLNDRVFIGESCWISTGTINGEIRFDNDVFIAHRCTITGHGGKILLGNHVHISRNSYLNGIGDIEIGNDTMIGPNSVLISGTHNYNNVNIPIRLQEGEKLKIRIENDVWLGASVNIMPGVTIGKGTVIGSGAVVTSDIPAYSVAVGVPAKVIGNREEKSDSE